MILLVLVNILYTIIFVYLGYFFYRADVKQRNKDNYFTLIGYSIVFLPIYIVINSKLNRRRLKKLEEKMFINIK